MPRRIARKLVNMVWYSTALAIVFSALLVTIGREFLPRINLQSDMIARRISTVTGVDIRFENLHGQWIQLLPELSAGSVSIKNRDMDIQLNKVHMYIDLLNCILERRIVLDRLEIDSADIHYRIADPTNNTPVNIDEASRGIYALLRRSIQIQNVSITTTKGDKTQQFNLKDFRAEQTLTHRKIFLRLIGDDGEEDLFATGTVSGNLLSTSTGHFYVNVGDWPLQEWLPSGDNHLPPAIQSLRDAPWHIGGEMWIDWEGLDSVRGFADLKLDNPQTGNSLPEKLQAVVSGQWQPGQQQLVVHSLAMDKDHHPVRLLENLQVTHEQGVWHLQNPALRLDPLAVLATYLPHGTGRDLLVELQPKGVLRHLDLTWDTHKPLAERMRLRAIADNLASQPWHGVPAFTQINGYLDSGIGYGFIDLDSPQGFSMHYPDIYHHPLAFNRAAGRVQWQWLEDEKTVLVGSDHASLTAEDGEAHGNFWLNLPLAGATSSRDMYLAIGLRNSAAKFRNKYLPYILPTSLLHWLETSIGDAVIPDAGFIYRGALSGKETLSRSVQFYANLEHGDIQFDPGWPRLNDLKGKLLVDDGNTIVHATQGKLYSTRIDNTRVETFSHDNQLVINVHGNALGPAEDGIRILRDTTLRNTFGNTFDTWQVNGGQLTSNLQLTIPLLASTEPARQDIRCQLVDSNITLVDMRLPIEKLTGNLVYQSSTGLSSPRLDARLFGEPVALAINSVKTPDTLSLTLKGTGKADAKRLADWSRLTPMHMLSGQLDYEAMLKLGPFGKDNTNKIGTLTLNSTMKNIALPLPAPLQKTAGTIAPLKMTIDLLHDNRQDYRLNYNQQIDGAVSMQNGNFFAGNIDVADGTTRQPIVATLPNVAGPLRITGSLPHAGLEDWSGVISDYNKLPKPQSSAATPYPVFALTFGNFTWTDQSFPDTTMAIAYADSSWQVAFDGYRAKGTARFYDTAPSGITPLPDITFDTLKIDSAANPEKTAVYDIDFADIPSLNLAVDHFIFNGMDIGKIRMQMESQPKALLFHKLYIEGPGYQVKAKKSEDKDMQGAEVVWRQNTDGLYQSEFHGMLHMQGKQPALSHLGLDPFVQGENIYLTADIAWPGSPLDMHINTLYGQVETHGKKGKYLQAKPTAAMHAINVLDIATWVRRLRLDFSDLSNDGISFDKYKGALLFNNGTMEFTEPLHVESPSSSVQMAGKAFLNAGQLDLKLIATLPVGNNATWIAALAGGLPAAAGVYLVSKVFSDQLDTITSLSYTITGEMSDPDIEFERIAPPKLEKGKTK